MLVGLTTKYTIYTKSEPLVTIAEIKLKSDGFILVNFVQIGSCNFGLKSKTKQLNRKFTMTPKNKLTIYCIYFYL